MARSDVDKIRNKTFSKRYKEARERCGYTLNDVAAMVGVSHSAASMWSQGRTAPHSGNMRKLEKAFNVGAGWFVGHGDMSPTRNAKPNGAVAKEKAPKLATPAVAPVSIKVYSGDVLVAESTDLTLWVEVVSLITSPAA